MKKTKAIEVKGVSKTFLKGSGPTTLKQLFTRSSSLSSQKTGKVLEGINLAVDKGEFFGLVGRNGGGKSTLLKLIAGIYSPGGGEVLVDGQLIPFIELGVGFNQEISARDNVYLNGALLGFSRSDVEKIYDEIVDFAELGGQIDKKLKNFSSGMRVRLAFSIAIRSEGDILLIDEVLAVGDASFKKKCYDYFNGLKDSSKTVVFVSHDMASIQKYCDRVAVIDEGHIVFDGPPREAAQVYNRLFQGPPKREDVPVYVEGVELVQGSAEGLGDVIRVELEFLSSLDLKGLNCGFHIERKGRSGVLLGTNSRIEGVAPLALVKGRGKRIRFEFPGLLPNGDYVVSATLISTDASKKYVWERLSGNLKIRGRTPNPHIVQPNYKVSVSKG